MDPRIHVKLGTVVDVYNPRAQIRDEKQRCGNPQMLPGQLAGFYAATKQETLCRAR